MFKKKTKPEAAAPEADAAVEGAEGAPKKKGKLKLMIIAGVGALVVLGGGGAAAMLLMGGGGESAEAQVAEAAPTDPDAEPFGQVTNGPAGTTYYTLPTLATNINSAGGQQQHMSLQVTLEITDPAMIPELERNAPRLRDSLLTFQRELRAEDVEGSQGTFQLRQEIQRRVNLVMAPAQVRSVLIQQMLIS